MFYIEKNNKIVLYNEIKAELIKAIALMPWFQSLEIKETNRPIEDFQFSDTEEYEEQQIKKEREELDKLSLTAADVERAIYQTKGIDFEDIIDMIKEDLSSDIDLKALKIELKANNFYRGNLYINKVGLMLGFSMDQLDRFFKTNDYNELLK